MKSFKQFFHTNNSLTQSMVRRNPRRNMFKPKIAKDHKLSGERKTVESEIVSKGLNSKVFLSHNKAADIAQEYGINLPEEGEEKKLNSNSQQTIIKHGGFYYLTGSKVTT